MQHNLIVPEVQETTVMNYLSWPLFLPLHLHAYADMVTDTQGGLMRPSTSHGNSPEMCGHATVCTSNVSFLSYSM